MVKLTKVLAGLLLVVAVALGIFAWMIARQPPPIKVTHEAPPTFAVVVAAHALPAGQPIKAGDLDVARVSQTAAGTFSDATSVIGRVPLSDVNAGQPIVDSALLEGLAGRLEPGERAIAVKVDEIAGVGGRVRPGDWVDVFMLLRRDGQDGEIGRTQARLLLSKVRVLAYGRADVTVTDTGAPVAQTAPATPSSNAVATQPPPSNVQNPPNAANDPLNAHTAVIAVPVDHVDALALADSSGRLFFALRNPADKQVADDRVFGSSGTVLVPVNGEAALQGDAPGRAAAGLSLEQLVRDKGAQRSTAPMPLSVAAQPPLPQLMPVASRSIASRSTGQGVEVIRGNSRETVGW
jgi:pilus assembly protein CpaB